MLGLVLILFGINKEAKREDEPTKKIESFESGAFEKPLLPTILTLSLIYAFLQVYKILKNSDTRFVHV